jgi:Methane oxygenase PmoA
MQIGRRNSLSRIEIGTVICLGCGAIVGRLCADDLPTIAFRERPNQIEIMAQDIPLATYVFQDAQISRPYFAHVKTLDGIRVTRNYPPVAGVDRMDHPTFHPGIWLSFGDLAGNDYWRLKAGVVQAGIIEHPHGEPGRGSFAVRNRYLDPRDDTKTTCEEECRFQFVVQNGGYLLTWDSTFHSDHAIAFGDQQEMGLGFRVATPLRVESTTKEGIPAGSGTILDSEGRRNEHEVAGNAADWCDYSGTLAGRRVGITIFCHPDNFRPSWLHARDYGLLTANPFGRAAFHHGEPSSVVVEAGDKLRLRYGVFVHSGPAESQLDLATAYREYVAISKQ